MEGQYQNSSENSEYKKHQLNTNWIVWYHNPSDKSWSLDSYKSILELSYLEDFLVLKNSWAECLPSASEGMFFLMRKIKNTVIYPQWEDENNKQGGYWSFKIPKESSHEIWLKLCSYTIGEQLCNNVTDSLQINGISISPKKNFCIIKIWNNNQSKNNVNILSDEMTFLDKNEVKYSSHNNNIQRDYNKFYKKENRRYKKGYNKNRNRY